MAQRPARPNRTPRAQSKASSGGKRAGQGRPAPGGTKPGAAEVAPATRGEPRTLRLGAVPGATPGTWLSRWRERMPHVALELVPLPLATQRSALDEGTVDIALVREPIEREGLHLIALYDEVPVVVTAAESALTSAEELSPADLAGEVLLHAADEPWFRGEAGDFAAFALEGTLAPAFGALPSVEDAVATVAAGVGIMVVPMSLARLHHRRDVTFRPLAAALASPVALAWPREGRTPDEEADVQAFIGIVRGRRATSSRD